MYTPPQQETDRFKAGRSTVLPQNRSFLFQMPNELPQNRRCLPDVYPPKRLGRKGLRVFCPSAPSTRRATPFRMSKGRETPAARALCSFFLSRMLGIWYRRNGAIFGFFSLLHKAEGGFPFARAAPKPPETALRQRKNGTKERKFQKGE